MNIQKNQEYTVEIIDNGYEGEGIAKIDNFTIFVPGAIKGEKVKILIVKVVSSHAFGKILEIIDKSETRQDADCSTYKRCGGCNLRHIKYEETLKSEIAKDDAPTLFQINGPVGYQNWKEYTADLKDTELYKHLLNEDLAIKDGDGVYGIPYVEEGYGIIYNQKIMDKG